MELTVKQIWQNGILFTGGEDKNITAWDTKSGKVAYTIEDAHPARVKGIVVLSKNDDASSEEDPYTVASASSDGIIRVWDMRMANKDKPNPLAEANTKSRLTCLAGSSVKCKPHTLLLFCYSRLFYYYLDCYFNYILHTTLLLFFERVYALSTSDC